MFIVWSLPGWWFRAGLDEAQVVKGGTFFLSLKGTDSCNDIRIFLFSGFLGKGFKSLECDSNVYTITL